MNILTIKRSETNLRSNELQLFYKKKKYLPLDLRPKKTKAKRLALTCYEKGLMTLKAKKKQKHFPQRVYALEA
ncbi:hypothetical protein PORY_002255 [Pneumocystis oryctolagi]|uniref:Uncharacterized protein n=1 Tax=Pneumocystis oryctolagi TaxID=42067 RepID=A0ACB7C9Z0_9ASCO|nr:hypothetical protein PORY_002255 [Pneumocystis oryctolagi]